jgi:hypothetical protein
MAGILPFPDNRQSARAESMSILDGNAAGRQLPLRAVRAIRRCARCESQKWRTGPSASSNAGMDWTGPATFLGVIADNVVNISPFLANPPTLRQILSGASGSRCGSSFVFSKSSTRFPARVKATIDRARLAPFVYANAARVGQFCTGSAAGALGGSRIS